MEDTRSERMNIKIDLNTDCLINAEAFYDKKEGTYEVIIETEQGEITLEGLRKAEVNVIKDISLIEE